MKFAKIYYFHNWQNPDFEHEEGISRFKNGIYEIHINADLPSGRDSFTTAHELGHVILGHHKYDLFNLPNQSYRKLDREADVFAASLLMPEEWMRELADPPLGAGDIFELKEIFKVSWTAMINRLDELGMQGRETSNQCFKRTANV
jgi:Zn-dependent peptidase ImmA (M78 family)